MVDDDLLNRMKSGEKKKKKKKKEKSKSSGGSSSSSGDGEPFSLSQEARMQPDDVEVPDAAEEIAEGAQLNTSAGATSRSAFRKRQIQECEELYDDVRDNVNEYGGDLREFTAIFQAIIMNLAQNRHGIAMTLMDEFGMSESEARKEAHKITKKAGELETIDWTIQTLTKNLMK